MKRIITVIIAATIIEYIVNSYVAPNFFNISPQNIIFELVLISNIITAFTVSHIYKDKK